MVLLNTAMTIAVSALMIITLCLMAESFMQAHLDDTVLDEVHVLEAELSIDGPIGVASLIKQRLAANPTGRQAYLLLAPDGRKLAGNLDQIPPSSDRRATWRKSLQLRQPIASTLRWGSHSEDIGTSTPGSSANHHLGGWHAMPTLHPNADATLRLRSTRLIDGSGLVVGYDDREIAVFVNALQRSAAFGLGITVVLGVLAGALSSRLTLNQIDGINRTANRIIAGDLNQRVPLRGTKDEFDGLGVTLNEMLDRINELMNAVRYATESIAHDLRSPLTRMRNRIVMARKELAPGGQTELLDQLCGEVDRVLTVFSSLLRLATIESGVLRSGFLRVELGGLVEDAVSLYDALAGERGIEIGIVLSPNCTDGVSVDGDRDLLFQAICNLLDNAVKFSPDGAEVGVELSIEQGRARVRIRDHGPGIPADQRERVFDRLVRLDSSRGSPGFGLGLSLVRGIVNLHHGDCRLLEATPGTLAELSLPLAD